MKSLLKILISFSLVFNSFNGFAQQVETDQEFAFIKFARVQIGAAFSDVSYNSTQERVKGFILDHSYLIKPKDYYAIGLGSAVQLYEKQIFFPVYFNLIACTKNNFYMDFQPGFSVGWERKSEYYENFDLKGGLYSKFGLGYKIRINDEFSSCIQFSYSFQNARLESDHFPTELLNLHSFMVSFGLLLDRK